MAATLYFEKLKEHRGDYFVEYHPPVSANQFATLTLVHHDDKIPLDLADVMVRELQYWLAKYPVPVMVSASDAANSHIKPKEFDGDGLFDGFLVGWIDPVSKDPAWSWAIDDLTKFNEQHPYQGDWRSIYTDVPCRTQEEVTTRANEHFKAQRRQVGVLRGISVLWLCVFPACWALFEYLGPEWLGLLIFLYSLHKAVQTWREITGRRRSSARELEKAEKQRKMEHYYYHCERNPQGFAAVMSENLKNEIREDIRREADELAKASAQRTL